MRINKLPATQFKQKNNEAVLDMMAALFGFVKKMAKQNIVSTCGVVILTLFVNNSLNITVGEK